jgi:hypothetical protein
MLQHLSTFKRTVLVAPGLVVFPGSVQEVQANPCAENCVNQNPISGDSEEVDADRV